jgi:uncharacterized protein YjdB/alpha-tubulin suppressor-like RCC1 family protein
MPLVGFFMLSGMTGALQPLKESREMVPVVAEETIKPAYSPNAPLEIAAIGIGERFGVVADTMNRLYTWGNNQHSVLATGSPPTGGGSDQPYYYTPTYIGDANMPASLLNGTESVSEIYVSYTNAFLLTSTGNMYVWGRNDMYQTGLDNRGTVEDIYRPTLLNPGNPFLPDQVAFFVNGSEHSILLLKNGDAYAWGRNPSGVFGDGTQTSRVMTKLPDTAYKNTFYVNNAWNIRFFDAGDYFNFIITNDNNLYTWGQNAQGATGVNSTIGNILTPTLVPSFRTTLGTSTIALGFALLQSIHVVLNDGYFMAWGNNDYGQLGFGNQTRLLVPTKSTTMVPFLPSEVSIIDEDFYSLTVRLRDNRVFAWGYNSYAQLGFGPGDRQARFVPTPNTYLQNQINALVATTPDFPEIVMGTPKNKYQSFVTMKHNFARLGWGNNSMFQLGNDERIGMAGVDPEMNVFLTRAAVTTEISKANATDRTSAQQTRTRINHLVTTLQQFDESFKNPIAAGSGIISAWAGSVRNTPIQGGDPNYATYGAKWDAIVATATAVPATGVTLNNTTLTLTVGNSSTLVPTVQPATATNKNVTWSSSAPAVATVSAAGVVNAVAPGSATITATTVDGGFTATCAVTVNAAPVPVSTVTLNNATMALDVGATGQLVPTILPNNATNKNVTWSSSAPAVATVSATGLVTGASPGTATITVTTVDNSRTATCNVTVSAVVIPVTSVSLNQTTLSLAPGGTGNLVATVLPENATNKSVTWSSSAPAVATVSPAGVVSAVAAGTSTITVTTADGNRTATCALTVSAAVVPVTSVTLDQTTVALKTNESAILTPTILPENATNKDVTWSSSNEEVVMVTNGLVIPLGAGSATVTVTTVDGGRTATCAVTVTLATVAVNGLSLNKNQLSLAVAAEETLVVTINPSNATNPAVTWSSSNEDVATVSSDGLVKAIAPGMATITVKSVDSGYAVTCQVRVLEPLPRDVDTEKGGFPVAGIVVLSVFGVLVAVALVLLFVGLFQKGVIGKKK